MASLLSTILQYFLLTATKDGHAGEHALKLFYRLPHNDAFSGHQFEFADGFLMLSTAFLKHRNTLFHFSVSFEISQAYHGVRKITNVHRSFGGGSQSMLGQNEDRDDTLLVETGAEFVQLVVQILLSRHGVEITVETVNRDEFATRLHAMQNTNGEFTRRKFGGVNLLYCNRAAFDVFFQLETQRFGSAQHHAARFVKREYYRALTLIGHLDSVLQS